MRRKPYALASVFFLFCFVATSTTLHLFLPWSWIWIFLMGWNVATFLLYGFDKWQAGGKRLRVPEMLFYTVMFLGGSVGTLLGMQVFHHKTRKTSFQLVVALLLLIQVAIFVSVI